MNKKIFCIKCGKEINHLIGCHEVIEYKNVGDGDNLVDYVKETQPGGKSLGYFCQECGDYMFEHDEERADFLECKFGKPRLMTDIENKEEIK